MTSAKTDVAEEVRPDPNLPQLFFGFLSIALSGFGGTLVFARHILVEKRGWMTDREFTQSLSLCQFLPGPNICNMSIRGGAQFQGWPGSIACVLGLVLTPFLIVVALGALYDRYGDLALI